MADRAAAAVPVFEVVTPGDDVGAGHCAEFFRLRDASEAHEVLDRVFVGAAGLAVGQVGKPFGFGRHVGQTKKVSGGQEPVLGVDGLDGILEFGHEGNLLLIKSVIKSKRVPFCH